MTLRTFRADRREGNRNRSRRRRGPWLRRLLAVCLLLFAALLVYVIQPFWGERVVLLGSDARAGEPSRSDTIMVANPGDGMLSVPRDTLVEIPGRGEGKVNAAFAYGGPELAVRTLESFTGAGIGGYAVIRFEDVEEVVDALGGVTVNVEEPVATGSGVEIPAGEQTLDGEEALAYVRDRSGPRADIGRIGNQQKFLEAMAREASSPTNLHRLPGTALAAWDNIETNMNPIEAARFAARTALLGYGPTETYPGTPQYINGVSYWIPDREAGQQVVEQTIS